KNKTVTKIKKTRAIGTLTQSFQRRKLESYVIPLRRQKLPSQLRLLHHAWREDVASRKLRDIHPRSVHLSFFWRCRLQPVRQTLRPRSRWRAARLTNLATLHLSLPPRRQLFSAHHHEYVDALDVWPRTGNGVGKKPVPEILLSHRRGGGINQRSCENRACSFRSWIFICADDWSLRRYLRNSDSLRDSVSGPARLSFPNSGGNEHANNRSDYGCD